MDMSPRLKKSLLKCAALAFLFLGTTIAGSVAEAQFNRFPDNARKNPQAEGWECACGFKRVENRCVKIAIPKHAFATGASFGRSWECQRGHVASGERCNKVVIPENGYLDCHGNGWRCKRGYRKVADERLAVVVPKNAFVVNSPCGAGWECERGFRATG
ncbi:MAG: hypothetical protein ACR2PG_13420 [Hyphomicrobiaceae bacterium]